MTEEERSAIFELARKFNPVCAGCSNLTVMGAAMCLILMTLDSCDPQRLRHDLDEVREFAGRWARILKHAEDMGQSNFVN
jgi:hypothetical protein